MAKTFMGPCAEACAPDVIECGSPFTISLYRVPRGNCPTGGQNRAGKKNALDRSPERSIALRSCYLAVSAVESTTHCAMEPATDRPMEAATYCSVKRRSRMCNVAMDRAAIHRTTVVSGAISVAPSRAIVARMAVVAVEPGTGADEHATDEVVRPIVAIGRAGV